MKEVNHTTAVLIGLFVAVVTALILAAWQDAPGHTAAPRPASPAGDFVVIHQ